MPKLNIASDQSTDDCVWTRLKQEAASYAAQEPALSSLLHATILEQESLGGALINHLSEKLATTEFSTLKTRRVLAEAIESDAQITDFAAKDLIAVMSRDPACHSHLQAFMYFKGFMAIQTHRCAHALYRSGRDFLAFHFQNRASEKFGVLIGAGASILGNLTIGDGAKIAAGSVVLKDVESNCTVAGVPAKGVAGPCCGNPADSMDQNFGEDI